MKKFAEILCGVLLASLLLLLACGGGEDSRSAGGGVIDETVATVLTGVVTDKAGQAVRGCSLTVRDLARPVAGAALPKTTATEADSVLTLLTDAAGRFEIRGLAPSEYSVEGRLGNSLGAIDRVKLALDDSVAVAVVLDTLVVLRIFVDPALGATRAYIVELDRFVDVSGQGSVAIVGVPGGSYTIRIFKDGELVETQPGIEVVPVYGPGSSSSGFSSAVVPLSSSSSLFLVSSSGAASSAQSAVSSSSSARALLSGQEIVPCPAGSHKAWTCIEDSRDGEVYGAVTIGAQVWLAQSLRHGTMLAPLVSDAENKNSRVPALDNVAEKYCYGNLPANCAVYGGLYRWSEAFGLPLACDGDPAGATDCGVARNGDHQARGICPSGWHIASLKEWQTLAATVRSEQGLPYYSDVYSPGAGGILAGAYALDTGSWNTLGFDAYGDVYGFSALPVGEHYGIYDDQRMFRSMGSSLFFVTDSSNGNGTYPAPMWMGSDALFVTSGMSKKIAHPIRCLADSPP